MKRLLLFTVVVLLMITIRQNAMAMADTAASACLMNAVTGDVIFEKNADSPMPMASTTKIMTLITAIESSDPEEIVTVPHEATLEEGSSAYVDEGARITMRELFYGLMLNSGNDAAVAIACHISGSEAAFAEKMNELAERIGLSNSSFKNANGLDEEGHYTTARDLAKLTRYALQDRLFREIVSTRVHTTSFIRANGEMQSFEYYNHNKLLGNLEGCIGVKTGYTTADGRCLVSATERGGAAYIAVTLNCQDDWNEHRELHEFAHANTRFVNVVNAGDCIDVAECNGINCRLIAESDFKVPVNGDRGRAFDLRVKLPHLINMPLNKHERIGTADVYDGDSCLGKVNIIAEEEFVPSGKASVRMNFWYSMIIVLRNILG